MQSSRTGVHHKTKQQHSPAFSSQAVHVQLSTAKRASTTHSAGIFQPRPMRICWYRAAGRCRGGRWSAVTDSFACRRAGSPASCRQFPQSCGHTRLKRKAPRGPMTRRPSDSSRRGRLCGQAICRLPMGESPRVLLRATPVTVEKAAYACTSIWSVQRPGHENAKRGAPEQHGMGSVSLSIDRVLRKKHPQQSP